MTVATDDYRAALRLRLLGLPLTAEQYETLEAGRVEAGLREGCYPWPPGFADTLDRAIGGHPFDPPPACRPARHERYEPTIDEQIIATGRVPTRPVRQWRD